MSDYQCSCYMEYPNICHKNKNGTWKCIDNYEKCEDWQPKSIYACVTHCRRKGETMKTDAKNVSALCHAYDLGKAEGLRVAKEKYLDADAYNEGIADGREDERKKIFDILKTFTEGDYNSKECKLLVSDLREVLWEGEQNDK